MMEKSVSDAGPRRVAALIVGLPLFLLLLLLGISWVGSGWSLVEKLLTRMAMPCGLIWLGMLSLSLWELAGAARRRAWLGLALCLFYWTAGSAYTANRWIGLLERRYQPIDPATAPEFDLVVVLGGGTFSDAEGNTWLSSNGDRVMLAARLFAQGKIQHLATTGQVYEWYGGHTLQLSESTERIWRELGIPLERITQLGGLNTTQEMREVRRWLADRPHDRVGLLTSAYHLPRAMRLAANNGLQLTPIPAGFLAIEEPLPISLIPSSHGFQMSELAAKEYLAAVLGR